MRICAFTGPRTGMTGAQKQVLEACIRNHGIELMNNGDAIGADAEAQEVMIRLLLKFDLYPGFEMGHRNRHGLNVAKARVVHPVAPPLERNRTMIDNAKIVFAAPQGYGEVQRSGTWSAIRYAREIERPMVLIYPNGKMQREHMGD